MIFAVVGDEGDGAGDFVVVDVFLQGGVDGGEFVFRECGVGGRL